MRKESSTSPVYVGGTSIFVMLTAIFAAAKVFNFSDMSWLMVLSPIWGPFLLLFVILIACVLLVFVFKLVMMVVDKIQMALIRKRNKRNVKK